MSSLKRKLSRKKANKTKKATDKEMATKVALFGKLADECLVCKKAFDKTIKEQVMTWSVVVRQEEEVVNLYCPECWNKAIEIVEGFKEHLKNKQNTNLQD
jgi:hypothetical protein